MADSKNENSGVTKGNKILLIYNLTTDNVWVN